MTVKKVSQKTAKIATTKAANAEQPIRPGEDDWRPIHQPILDIDQQSDLQLKCHDAIADYLRTAPPQFGELLRIMFRIESIQYCATDNKGLMSRASNNELAHFAKVVPQLVKTGRAQTKMPAPPDFLDIWDYEVEKLVKARQMLEDTYLTPSAPCPSNAHHFNNIRSRYLALVDYLTFPDLVALYNLGRILASDPKGAFESSKHCLDRYHPSITKEEKRKIAIKAKRELARNLKNYQGRSASNDN